MFGGGGGEPAGNTADEVSQLLGMKAQDIAKSIFGSDNLSVRSGPVQSGLFTKRPVPAAISPLATTPSRPSVNTVPVSSTSSSVSNPLFGTGLTTSASTTISTSAPLFGTSNIGITSPLFGNTISSSTSGGRPSTTRTLVISVSSTTPFPLGATTTTKSAVSASSEPSNIPLSHLIINTKKSTAGSSLLSTNTKSTTTTSACLTDPVIPTIESANISYGAIEKTANKLIMDVLTHEKTLLNQILEINSYDREIRDNQKKLLAADAEVTALEESKDRLLHNLSFIDMQQEGAIKEFELLFLELEELVDDLEKKLNLPEWTSTSDRYSIDFTYSSSAEQQRVNIMKLLTSVDSQIKEAQDDINEVESQLVTLTAATSSGTGGNDPVRQIQSVLKKHLKSIIWVDGKIDDVNQKIEELSNTRASGS